MTMIDIDHCELQFFLQVFIYDLWTLVKVENSLYETESSSFKLPQI